MRVILLLSVFCLFLNCEDKKSNKKNKVETSKVIVDSIIDTNKLTDADEADSLKRPFPKLNSKNAMNFFLDYDKQHKENKVRITTDFGTIDILLYNETKFHRSNFIFLTKQNYFTGTQFYRVINNFMVQAGSSDDKITAKKRNYIGKYLLPPDTQRGFKHDRGAVSMPSGNINNPYKLASPFEFFIIQQHGGSHFLNGDYTIFGKVTSGMDVVDKIAAVKTDDADWPLQSIFIRKVEIIN